MASSAGPIWTTRPRTSRASTSNGRTASSPAGPSGSAALFEALIVIDCHPVEAPGEDALLRVQAVLGLVEHHRLRAVDHLVGHLLAAVGGQAVHEDRVGLGLGHQPAR